MALKLQRGVTVKGRVLDPDGKPVKSAVLYHPLSLRDNGDIALFYHYSPEPVAVKDGIFTLTGLDRKTKLPVYVLDRKNKSAAASSPASRRRGGDREVATLRPRPRRASLTPGASRKEDTSPAGFRPRSREARLAVASQFAGRLDRGDAGGTLSDAEGRVTVSGLIPGATYRYYDGKKVQEFIAEAGKTHDLGEILPPPRGGGGGGGAS